MVKKSDKAFPETKDILVTEDGLKQLNSELLELKTVKRKEVAGKIKEAISYGDLSENSEYEDAKNEQAFVEGRILELEVKVKNAKVVKNNSNDKKVRLGAKVLIQELAGDKEKEEFYIVGSTEADPLERKVSNESPLGFALLDKIEKDEVLVKAPSGDIAYKILKIS